LLQYPNSEWKQKAKIAIKKNGGGEAEKYNEYKGEYGRGGR
jgi:hypothetical protein